MKGVNNMPTTSGFGDEEPIEDVACRALGHIPNPVVIEQDGRFIIEIRCLRCHKKI